MNHLVLIILDSARFDAVKSAKTVWLKKLGKLEKRFSYASWTSPSHFNFMMGLLPHASPKRCLAAETYRDELRQWGPRLGIRKLSFEKFLPQLHLGKVLRDYGYKNHALVSLPVLNPQTAHSLYFDRYQLMPKHNQFHEMVESLEFSSRHPTFHLLNVGETHYPYAIPDERSTLPKLSGLHGTLKHLGDRVAPSTRTPRFFSPKQLQGLRKQQIECVEYVDKILGRLFTKCPKNTHLIVTSDHGEAFGEEGYFGHGPIFHEKVFEVPYVEGRIA